MNIFVMNSVIYLISEEKEEKEWKSIISIMQQIGIQSSFNRIRVQGVTALKLYSEG